MKNDEINIDLPYTSNRFIRSIEFILDSLCVALLVLMTTVTTIDVVGRYIFHSPIYGAFEANELLMALLVFTAFPRASWHRKHLTVTILDSLVSPTIRKFQEISISIISGGGLAILSYYLWQHGIQLAEYRDMSNALQTPLAPFAFMISIFTGFAALASFAHSIIKS